MLSKKLHGPAILTRLARALSTTYAALYDRLQLCGTKEAALHGADALVIMTEWRQFKAPDFDLLKKTLKQPLIFDGRNLFDPARMREKGFVYKGIGR